MAKLSKLALETQNHETILAHILDPDNSPLTPALQEQYNRVVTAARLIDGNHPSNVISKLLAKYDISKTQARKDIALAQELFKSYHTFDWDFWQAWQIKDLVDTIRTCKLQNKQKERIMAQKVLKEIIGEKTVAEEDPRRMEKNVFYIQLNHKSSTFNVNLDTLKGLSKDDIRKVIDALDAPDQSDEDIVEILNT